MQSLVDDANRVRPTAQPLGEDRWRAELREAIRDPHELVNALGLDPQLAEHAAEAGFPTLAPWPFVRRMRHGDPKDPLLLQVLPRAEEADGAGLPTDAVGDLAASPTGGLLKKYDGRALVLASHACAVHCRYCFRRHFPYANEGVGRGAWERSIGVIAADPSISEVILSGGDPLTLSDESFLQLVELIDRIPHVRRIRMHTRLPVVIPSRITASLLRSIRATRAQWVVVLHMNHANEIDDAVAKSIDSVRSAGAMILNQAVLLRSVNDNAATLRTLGERLVDVGVTPYYLHAMDGVAGTAHFGVDDRLGQELVAKVRSSAPGYLVPRFVREVAGETSKRVLQ